MSSSETAKGSFSSNHKVLIRKLWNQPLLKFLVKKGNDKLIYLGLPSSKAEDILAWIDFIKSVIAFQCRQYGEMSSPNQGREEIENLEVLLRSLERQRKLENFVVYDGYLEEVILRGTDNSPSQITFEQGSVITLYNLDFCNKITSPWEFVDRDGNIKTAYKFNAIGELLKIQDSLSKVSDKFIFLLTVHCSYDGKELHNFINSPPNGTIGAYIHKYKALSGHEKNARIVRLFVAYQIEKFFTVNNFTSKMLPVIKYQGLNDTPLLHFVVLGTKSITTATGADNFQSIEDIVDFQFISFESDEMVNLGSELEEKEVSILNSVDFFVQSKTYDRLWK